MVKSGKPKFHKTSKEDKRSDRISTLPDSLLSRILSLLPTKDAVATSLLSTRWKFRWTSITHLHIDDEFYTYPKKTLVQKRKKFTQFMNRVLLLLNPLSIQSFHLKCHHQLSDPFYLNSWVCAAIGRTVQELVLTLRMEKPMELPLGHFCFQTPAVLKLYGDIHFSIPALASICFTLLQTLHSSGIKITIPSNSSVSFPKLKFLHLYEINKTNQESILKLFQNCPILEKLDIKYVPVVSCLAIRIPSLRSLEIVCDSYEFPVGHAPKLHMATPALQYLSLEFYSYDSKPWNFTADNLSSLLEAKVIVRRSVGLNTDHTNSFSNNIIKFVEALSNAKFLTISGAILMAIRSASATFVPIFHNLTRLDLLEKEKCLDWSAAFSGLLHCMDNLEHLVMRGCYCSGSHESWWTEPLDVPKCLLSRLHTLSLSCNITCNDEIELVGYFLKNSQVLKLLTVNSYRYGSEERSKLMQKISMFPRGSNICQVKFD